MIIYKVSNLGITYKQYVSLSSMKYCNSMSSLDYISVGLIDYLQPYSSNIFGGLNINHNDALYLEGEWCNDLSKHIQLMEFISMTDVPEKEYVFKAHDWSKYSENAKDPKELMRTTKSFIAKTEHNAYELKKKFENKNKGEFIISDLLEVKQIN